MKIILRIAAALTILFFLYAVLTVVDQTYQVRTMTFDEKPNLSEQEQHLKHLGFSNIMLTHLKKEEMDLYSGYSGKVVKQSTIYRKVSGNDVKSLPKKEYMKLLNQYSKSSMPHTTSLEKVELKLTNVEGQKFLLFAEHHFDYSPRDLPPLWMEVQLGYDYKVLNQQAKQIWWTANNFRSKNIRKGSIEFYPTQYRPDVNVSNQFFPIYNEGGIFYSVPWKRPSLFEDVIALHFFTITEFLIPNEETVVNTYIQGENPYTSFQLFYDLRDQD